MVRVCEGRILGEVLFMSSLVLIPWPKTDWSEAGRIASRTPLPLNEVGLGQAQAWAAGIAEKGLDVVYSSKERVSVETAQVLVDRTRAKHKAVPELAEVDAGLWDGLATEEIKHRYPKIFTRWSEDPASVCPPEGEALAVAFERLKEPLDRLTRKQSSRSVGMVLGPLAFALVRCLLESEEPTRVRSMMSDAPLRYELNGQSPAAAPAIAVDTAP